MIASVDQSASVLAQILVFSEFANVYSNEVLGLPPPREVEFTIDLVLATMPISRAPSWMAPLELGSSRPNYKSWSRV